MRPFRIHERIAVPFVLVAVAATVVAALLAVSVISRTIQARVEAQLSRASAVVMRSDFALNPAILPLIRDISGSEIVTYSADGAVLASTLDPAAHGGLISVIRGAAGTGTSDTSSAPRRIEYNGVPYSVVYRRVLPTQGTVVALARDISDVDAGVRAARRAVIGTAIATIIVLILVSRLIARRVSQPIENLLDFARDVESGSARRAPVDSNDEIGRLGAAFNGMLDRLQRSQEALLRSEKLAVTGLLAARVAHDVRNPLSSIKMQTQMLRSRLRGQDDNHAMVVSILRDVGQVENVIKGLLELARPGELKRQPARLNDVVEDVLVHMMPQLTHNKIAIETSFDPNLPDVSLDAERFRQALLNLIANAAEAMPAGGTLSVSTASDSGDSHVTVDICDDGSGIDPAVADRVFDPFVSTKSGGVGLGLVNTKSIIESHGGRVALTPRNGRGTRARITLPAVREASMENGKG